MGLKAVENRVNRMKSELDYVLADVMQGHKHEALSKLERLDVLNNDLCKHIAKMLKQ